MKSVEILVSSSDDPLAPSRWKDKGTTAGRAIYCISFAGELYLMRYARPDNALLQLKVSSLRPNRVEPRCKKRRPKQ